LSEGTLRRDVQRKPGGRRVVVRVPDGEIEDLGTIFHVVVNRGRTERVGVDEGRVTIRLTDKTPITISSGQAWERANEEESALPVVVSGPTATTSTPSAMSPRPSPSDTTRRPRASAPSQMEPPTPNTDQEDAAYLHAIQLLREGRDVEASAAANDYLRRFPDGFRREEMGRIAR
jgi:TolA-binding protein